MTMRTRNWMVLALLLFLATVATAQQHPNIERGLLPDKSYQISDIDSVNLFNGVVNVSLPLGPQYPVNGTLSYRFMLSYGTNSWETAEWDEEIETQQPPITVTRRWAFPARKMTGGLGWNLT